MKKATTDKLPKYFRIMQTLIGEIRSGRLAAGQLVPSENELIRKHSISNTTARKVHAELEQAGWVTKVKGKGTFVRPSRVDRSVDRILGFTRNMVEAGRQPSTELLSTKVLKSPRRISINGRRYSLPAPVCEIKRLRLADNVPMMIETRYVSERLCPGIHKRDLTESLYEVYQKHYDLELVQIDQSVSAVLIDAEKTGFTGVTGTIPAFRVEGVTSSAKELVLEMEESIYRGDRYRFSVRATATDSRNLSQ